MFVKCDGVQLGSGGNVLSGCYGWRAESFFFNGAQSLFSLAG